MRTMFPASELARDDRFHRITTEQRFGDPRNAALADQGRMRAIGVDGPERAQRLMHGIFVGEVQALEGAGRTAFDFAADQATPYELRLDMARQAWDEARHCEMSVKLLAHMGVELGEYSESTFLFEICCSEDALLRLAGVNRALEGLAIDVFTTMREFGQEGGDAVMTLCEDWMLADEVTHVKMGSDWLRKLAESDPDRGQKALEFQRTVDRLFSFGGQRGDDENSFLRLSRRYRELAGFSDGEITEIAELGGPPSQIRVEATRN